MKPKIASNPAIRPFLTKKPDGKKRMPEKQKKPVIGVVVAIEIDSVLEKYGKPAETISRHGYTVRKYDTQNAIMYIVDSGAGELSAATGAQLLISEYNVDMIFNSGVVGALTEDMKTAGICVVESVVHYDFDTTGWLNLPRGQYPGFDSPFMKATPELVEKAVAICPDLKRVTCASADKFVDKAADKSALHEKFNADICEMEAAGIILTCTRCGVPCLIIKAVADSLTGGGAEFFEELERVSGICFDVVDRLVSEMFG